MLRFRGFAVFFPRRSGRNGIPVVRLWWYRFEFFFPPSTPFLSVPSIPSLFYLLLIYCYFALPAIYQSVCPGKGRRRDLRWYFFLSVDTVLVWTLSTVGSDLGWVIFFFFFWFLSWRLAVLLLCWSSSLEVLILFVEESSFPRGFRKGWEEWGWQVEWFSIFCFAWTSKVGIW